MASSMVLLALFLEIQAHPHGQPPAYTRQESHIATVSKQEKERSKYQKMVASRIQKYMVDRKAPTHIAFFSKTWAGV